MKSKILQQAANSLTFTHCTHARCACREPAGMAGDLQPIKPMKARLHLFLLPALIAGLNLIPAGRATSQTFTTLHSFDGSDGDQPVAGLILSGNTLYGTTSDYFNLSFGTVFAVNTDGTGFTNLYSFTAAPDLYIIPTATELNRLPD